MFYVRYKNKVMELDGEEEYFSKCAGCGKELIMDADEFYDIAQQFGIYDSMLYCNSDCSKKGKLRVVK